MFVSIIVDVISTVIIILAVLMINLPWDEGQTFEYEFLLLILIL